MAGPMHVFWHFAIHFTLLWSLVAWISPLALPFCHRKQLPLAFWQTTFFKLFSFAECVCEFATLTGLWFHVHKWNPVSHLLLTERDWEIHCHPCGTTLRKSKSKSEFCAHPWAFLDTILHKLVTTYLNYDNIEENSAHNLWIFKRNFRNCEAPSFTNFLVNILSNIITYYRVSLLFIMNICLPIFEYSTPLLQSSFTHYILAVNHST
jgi:hypothetical protein